MSGLLSQLVWLPSVTVAVATTPPHTVIPQVPMTVALYGGNPKTSSQYHRSSKANGTCSL